MGENIVHNDFTTGQASPNVSVVMVSYNTCQMTLNAIQAVYQSIEKTDFSIEIVLVDNASSDNTVEQVRATFPHVRLVESDMNLGFGVGNNHGAAVATGGALFMLNTDTEIRAGAIEKLYEWLIAREQRAVVGAWLEYPDGRYQQAILRFPTVWRIFCLFFWLDRIPSRFFSGMFDIGADPKREQEIEVAHGAAMMIRRDVFERVQGFDPAFFMYFEECDLCRRITDLGYTIGYVPDAQVVHYEGGSSQSRPWWFFRALRESRMIYARKHLGLVGQAAVGCIVHVGYAVRIFLFGVLGIVNPRLRKLGKNMLLSYIYRPEMKGRAEQG